MLGNAEKLFFQLCRKQWALWGMRGGSLLIITAERTAQTTALHSHHEGYNTLHLTLNIFAASMDIYPAVWLHRIYRKSLTDLEQTNSFVYNLKTWWKSIRHVSHLLFLFPFVKLCWCLSDCVLCLSCTCHSTDSIIHTADTAVRAVTINWLFI